LRCARCGYDLRGSAATCPECATPVTWTVAETARRAERRRQWRGRRRWLLLGGFSLLMGAAIAKMVAHKYRAGSFPAFVEVLRRGLFRASPDKDGQTLWTEAISTIALFIVGLVCLASSVVPDSKRGRVVTAMVALIALLAWQCYLLTR
jgi:hypothetical protein